MRNCQPFRSFQLTRSVGSVTTLKSNYIWRFHEFQLTRSVGSVTIQQAIINEYIYISTHTLRGERDIQRYDKRTARHTFQLTRSVGSVTLHIVYVKSHHHNRADILLKITLKIDIFYIICIIFSANLHIKPISLHVRSQNQTALRVICFLCTYMLHSPLPIITQIIESKAILFFINNFHKSIF